MILHIVKQKGVDVSYWVQLLSPVTGSNLETDGFNIKFPFHHKMEEEEAQASSKMQKISMKKKGSVPV